MTDNSTQIARVRSLIFESVSRSNLFESLLDEVDGLIHAPNVPAIDVLSSDFADATTTAHQAAAAGQGATEVRFGIDRKGRILGGSARAISLFSLSPGESLYKRLGESGRAVLEELCSGKRSQGMFTLFADPRPRPVLVLAQFMDDGTIDAFAVLVQWNSAIAPLLRDGFALTEAEVDIVELLFQGNSPKEIARRRERSPDTVRTQLRTICQKTDTHGISDVVHLAYGLIATVSHIQSERGTQAHGNYMVRLPSGCAMDVEITGPIEGRALLFLHGCLGGRRLPAQALQALSHRRIIAPGRPGHGQTRLDARLGLSGMVDDLVAMLDHFHIRQLDVLSYDLGAPFALWLAQRIPERLGSVVSIAPVPPLVRWADMMRLPPETRVFSILSRLNPQAARYLALLGGQRILRQGPEGFGDIVFKTSAFDRKLMQSAPEIQRLFWHGHAWHVEQGPDGFLADARLSSKNWDAKLPRLSVPVTFIAGEEDRNVPLRALSGLADRVGAEMIQVPNCGHSLLHSDPQTWLAHL